jgi:hypothetical protein
MVDTLRDIKDNPLSFVVDHGARLGEYPIVFSAATHQRSAR